MSVASYLQMTEVVQSCRAFIKDALNISIKQEAPDSVVVDYNKRQMVSKDGQRKLDRKPSNFWATSILSKLSIKASNNQGKDALEEEDDNGRVKEESSDIEVTVIGNEGCALVTHGASGNWTHQNENSSDSAETNDARSAGDQVFVWSEPATGGTAATPAAIKREAPDAAAGSGRRKKQTTTRRFVYNFPPEPEEGFDEGMFIQPSASYPREDFSSLSENAGKRLLCTLTTPLTHTPLPVPSPVKYCMYSFTVKSWISYSYYTTHSLKVKCRGSFLQCRGLHTRLDCKFCLYSIKIHIFPTGKLRQNSLIVYISVLHLIHHVQHSVNIQVNMGLSSL